MTATCSSGPAPAGPSSVDCVEAPDAPAGNNTSRKLRPRRRFHPIPANHTSTVRFFPLSLRPECSYSLKIMRNPRSIPNTGATGGIGVDQDPRFCTISSIRREIQE
jgi:hypothetical protein